MAKNKQNSAKTASAGLRENRIENVLAFMAAGVIGVSIICMAISLIYYAMGGSPMQIIAALPLVGFPIGFILVFSLLITAIVRKARENRK
jgi:FtsH-binding integral membrane protein